MKATMRLLQGLIGGKTKLCLRRKASVNYGVDTTYRWHSQYNQLSFGYIKESCREVRIDVNANGDRTCISFVHYCMVDVIIDAIDICDDNDDFVLFVSYVYKRRKLKGNVVVKTKDLLYNMNIELPPYSEERSLQIAWTGMMVYVQLDASGRAYRIAKSDDGYHSMKKATIIALECRQEFVSSGFMSCSNGCGETKTFVKMTLELKDGKRVVFDDALEEVML